MKIKISQKEYEFDKNELKDENLLNLLTYIKTKIDNSLVFRSGCKSGVCGSCGVRVNNKEVLSCKANIKDGDHIEPLKNLKVIKDLVVDLTKQEEFLKRIKVGIEDKSEDIITFKNQKSIDIESNCILCNNCFSSCPVYEVNPKFLAPYALIRSYRYINDKKEKNIKPKIDAIQTNGIWDCTLCGNCNMVCPEHIDIKGGIEKLRNSSVQFGYTNPNFANYDIGFNLDF